MQKSFSRFFIAVGLVCAMSLLAVACGKKISAVSSESTQITKEVAADSAPESSEQEQATSPESADAQAAQNAGELTAEDLQKREEILAQLSPLPADLVSLPKAPIEGTPAEFEFDASQTAASLSLIEVNERQPATRGHFTPTSGAGDCLVRFAQPQASLRAGCFQGQGGGTRWLDITSDSTKVSSHECVRIALKHWHTKCVTDSELSSSTKNLRVEYRGVVNNQRREVVADFWASTYCQHQVLFSPFNSRGFLTPARWSAVDYWGMSYYDFNRDTGLICALRAKHIKAYALSNEARCMAYIGSADCRTPRYLAYGRSGIVVNAARCNSTCMHAISAQSNMLIPD